TADQFYTESQFESYRALGHHVVTEVFGEPVRQAGARDVRRLFSELRRLWFPPPPDLEKNFLESVKGFVEVQAALRTSPGLARLSRDLYPELGEPPAAGPGAADAERDRA